MFLVTLLLAALSAAPARAADEPAPSGPVQAHVASVEGDAFVFYADAPEEGVPLKADAPLDVGDRVTTGKDGKAEIGLESDGVIDLGPEADFTIGSLEREEPSFTLAAGNLLAKIKAMFAPQGRLSVHTPTAVAAVRGTEFGVEFEEGAAETHVGVFDEGKVAVTPENGGPETLLKPNEETSVARGGSPLAARRLRRFARQRARMARVRGRIAFLRAHWRRLPPARRLELRRELRERFRSLPPEQCERIRERIQQRRKIREERRQKMEERREKIQERRRERRDRRDRRRGGPR